MSDRSQGTCRGCGAPVIWLKTPAGKWMICNPEPVFFTPGEGPESFVTPQGKLECGKRSKEGKFGYVSHWATCPKAKQFKSSSAVKTNE